MATERFDRLSLMESFRKSSTEVAEGLGYSVNPRLPLLDASDIVRSAPEIVDRALAIHGVAAAAYGFDRSAALSWLRRQSCYEALTPTEVHFLDAGLGDPQRFANQVEGLFALSWALNVVGRLDFSRPCPNDFVFQLPNLKAQQDGQGFRLRARLRTPAEILAATDLAYCLHWAIRDAQLKCKESQGKVEEYVLMERRRALEWLVMDEGWEEIELDT